MQPYHWIILALVVGIGANFIGIWLLTRADRPAPDPMQGEREVALEGRLAALEVRVEALPSLWKGEADRAEEARDREYRHAQRAAEAERRSRERDEDRDQIPEPLPAVPDVDASASEENGLPSVREALESNWTSTMNLARQSGFPWAGGD